MSKVARVHLVVAEEFDGAVLVGHKQRVEILVVPSVLVVLADAVEHCVAIHYVGLLALGQETRKNIDAFAVASHIGRLFIHDLREAKAVLFEDLRGRLARQLLKHLVDFTILAREDLELLRLDDELVLAALAQESLQQLAALLDKAVLFVTKKLLLRNGRDIAAGPALVQSLLEGQELLVAALDLEAALRIVAGARVLDDAADLQTCRVVHLDWVAHSELVFRILKALSLSASHRFGSLGEERNLMNFVVLDNRGGSHDFLICLRKLHSHAAAVLPWLIGQMLLGELRRDANHLILEHVALSTEARRVLLLNSGFLLFRGSGVWLLRVGAGFCLSVLDSLRL